MPVIMFIPLQNRVLPYKDNSLAAEDDSVPSDAYEYRHKQKVDLATFYRDWARCQVPYAPDQRPIVPHQRNSFRDYDQIPVCPLVLADIPYEATPIKKFVQFSKSGTVYKIEYQYDRKVLITFVKSNGFHLKVFAWSTVITWM